jgi:small GTP-binding protein
MENIEKIKITVLGNTGTGKTFFCNKIQYDNYFQAYSQPTIGVDFLIYRYTDKLKKHVINIWDLAGDDRFLVITKRYLTDQNLFLFFCDSTNVHSIKSLNNWLEHIRKQNGYEHKFFCAIICTKTDLIKKENKINNFTIDRYLENFSEQFQDHRFSNGKIYYVKENSDSKSIIQNIVKDFKDYKKYYPEPIPLYTETYQISNWARFTFCLKETWNSITSFFRKKDQQLLT